MPPILTGSDDVGVGVTVATVVGVAVGVAVSEAVAVGVNVGVVVSSSPPPQAANIDNIKTKARARPINSYHKLLFSNMVTTFCYDVAKQQRASSVFTEPAPSTASHSSLH